MTREGLLFRTIFMDAEPPITFAPIVNPYRLHELLVLQQGSIPLPGEHLPTL
jgi:hypothetical protein